jgi:hypothetical protein
MNGSDRFWKSSRKVPVAEFSIWETFRVGLIEVNSGQIQRSLTTNLKESFALMLGRVRLVRAIRQPANHSASTASAIRLATPRAAPATSCS